MLHSIPLPYSANAGEYFATLADLPWAIWLDSGGKARYDILVAQPIATLTTHGAHTKIQSGAGHQTSSRDPFELLREQLGPLVENTPGVPFCGGALGYWGYDLARRWVKPTGTELPQDDLPDMSIGIYDWAVLIDHQEQKAHLVSCLRSAETLKTLPDIVQRLQQKCAPLQNDFRVTSSIRSNFSHAQYNSAFAKVHDYLIAGDCYQINLAQRFSAQASGNALHAYMNMRAITPSPYSAFLSLPQVQILSVSPERFLHVQNRLVETKPIKGTRRRGINAKHDEQLVADLSSNEKDRAENLMIVDLLRNDLNKNCKAGSVKVSKLFEVESYANVHHLVSTITAELSPDKDALALLQGCFPGGSITGAPKKRAMEIIEQLEPQRRGLYCGAIGYVGWDGQMDSSIAIRTLIYSNGEIHFSAGGGIVADSCAADEYQETLDKASGMLTMLALYDNTKFS